MSDSILTSTKKILGIEEDYTAFDVDVLMHINSVFSTLNQLGIGPEEGYAIEDATPVWSDFFGPELRLNSIKTYTYLRVRLLFDPPQTSFHISALKEQILELEWRLTAMNEEINTVVLEDEDDVDTTAITSDPLESGELLINTDTGDVWRVL